MRALAAQAVAVCGPLARVQMAYGVWSLSPHPPTEKKKSAFPSRSHPHPHWPHRLPPVHRRQPAISHPGRPIASSGDEVSGDQFELRYRTSSGVSPASLFLRWALAPAGTRCRSTPPSAPGRHPPLSLATVLPPKVAIDADGSAVEEMAPSSPPEAAWLWDEQRWSVLPPRCIYHSMHRCPRGEPFSLCTMHQRLGRELGA
jgi:hypothetical protein